MKAKRKRLPSLVGTTVGMLTVVGEVGVDAVTGRKQYRCLCECGNEKITSAKNLQRAANPNCGCCPHTKPTKPERPQLVRKLLDQYKRNATVRGLRFDLPVNVFQLLIECQCFYCGREPQNEKSLRDVTLRWNGIDRKNNKEGYTADNSVPCCSDCNYMKGDRDADEFIRKIRSISARCPLPS